VHGYYLTGDGARRDAQGNLRDAQGNFWIVGRVDDVVIVSGHNIHTSDVESAVAQHSEVAETAAVGVAHPVKGQCLHVFIHLAQGAVPSQSLQDELRTFVRNNMGAFAASDEVHFTTTAGLPETRSGKIIRRILREIASKCESDTSKDLGDTSTLSNPKVVEDVIRICTGSEEGPLSR